MFINQVSDQWKQRVSIIVYAMVIVATVGWVLFMVFGAIGIVMLPMDWIREFIGRPKATITRSQYIDRARDLARRAKVRAGVAGRQSCLAAGCWCRRTAASACCTFASFAPAADQPWLPAPQDILALADALKREERERGRGWRWRRNAKALNAQLLVLEEDEKQLEMVYPQARMVETVLSGALGLRPP